MHRALLIRYPNDYDMYEALGYDLMRSHSPRDAMVAYDSFQAHRPPNAGTLINIAQVNIQLGRYPQARKAHVASLQLDSGFLVRVVQNEQYGSTLLALGFADSARVVHSVLLMRETQDKARGHRLLAYVDLYEGKYQSAVQHLKSAIDLGQATTSSGLSEIRDRALLANALLDLGMTADARDQLKRATTLCLTKRQVPQALFWTGKPLARLGDTVTAKLLLDSARARTRTSDVPEVAATSALEAEVLIARGNMAAGADAAEKATAMDRPAHIVDTYAYALERAGRMPEARAVYASLIAQPPMALETDGQQKARLAPLSVARIDLAMGRIDVARAALGAFMERWPSADANLPMMTTLRARINAATRQQ
jgi:tetratricopeptide (TPR) repeat protein